MPLGLNLLAVIAILVISGACSKMLERMQIKRYVILLIILAVLIGCLIPSIQISDSLVLNIGGSILPFAFFIFLIFKLKGAKDKIWTLAAALITATALFVFDKLVVQDIDTEEIIEPMYISALAGGVLANLLCRNYKSILANAIFGMIGSSAITFIEENATNGFAYMNFGSSTQFDCLILSIFSSMLIARAVLLVRQVWYRRAVRAFKKEYSIISNESAAKQDDNHTK